MNRGPRDASGAYWGTTGVQPSGHVGPPVPWVHLVKGPA